MKRFLRLVSLTLLIMSTSGNTFAEEKVNVARQGTIRGRIVDTSKQILPGASIYIEKLYSPIFIIALLLAAKKSSRATSLLS